MTGIVDFRTALLDNTGAPITGSNPLPTTGGGGGGGGSLSDTVFVDSTGQLFVYRDTGSGTPNAYSIPAWTLYTPIGTVTSASSGNSAASSTGSAVPGSASYTGFNSSGNLVGVSSTNPFPVVASDPSTTVSFGPITAANTQLFTPIDTANDSSIQIQIAGSFAGGVTFQASDDGVTYFPTQGTAFNSDFQTVDTLYAPDVVSIPVTSKYFRVVTTVDFVGSVSGLYSVRVAASPSLLTQTTLVNIDPQVSMPMAGMTASGMMKRLLVADNGGIAPADGIVFSGSRAGATAGTVVQVDTTGYGSIILQLAGTFTGTITFQVSNDSTTWSSAVAWPVAGAAIPVSTATAVGQWVIPAAGRFFRVQITTAGTGTVAAIAVMKNWSAWLPANIPQTNVAQIAGTAAVTAGVAGMLAVGGNIAEDAAATSNPVICGGVARTALPATTVIAGDAVRATYSVSGQMVTKENAPGDLDFYINATVTTSTQTQLRAAQAASIRTNLTNIIYQNTSATATTLTIQDGAATTLVTFSAAASMANPVQLVFPTPLRGTAATALNYTAGTTGANVLLTVTGFNSY